MSSKKCVRKWVDMGKKKQNRILIVNPFGIGDVLFSTPLISALRNNLPDPYIGYMCNKRTEPILNSNSNLDIVFVYEKDELRKLWSRSKLKFAGRLLDLIKQIRKERFNILIDLSLGHQYSMLLAFMGIRKRIGFNYKARGRFLTDKIKIDGYESRHIVDYYLSLLRFLDIAPAEGARLEFPPRFEDDKQAKGFLERHRIDAGDLIVGVVPGGGASWGQKASYKHWPEEKFAELIDRFAVDRGARVIIFGGESDRAICAKITALCKSDPACACGETDLIGFAALLRYCNLVVVNDGGPLHVAVSQSVPTVSIFGPVDERVYGPYPAGPEQLVIKKDVDCRPCYRKFKMPECANRICLQRIEVADVFTAAARILDRKGSDDKRAGVPVRKAPLSVVILTRDEELNIAACLESVAWADEIIVVDDFSADKTREIASRYTDKIFTRRMEIEGIHRNWAYAQAKNEWVLSLDADETVSKELRKEIERLVKVRATGFSAFSIPLRNYIGDYWIRHGGWYPAGKVRLFRKDQFRYEEVGVHPRVFIDGECGHLKGDIIHKGYPNFAHFVDSSNRQTSLEARKWVEDARQMSFARALRKANDRFFKTFILKKGFKDGFVGFMIAFFGFLYQIITYAKYWELKKQLKKGQDGTKR